MSDKQTIKPAMSIDVKNSLIIIHKKTLHMIGDPEYIQILVNPQDKSIIVCRSFENDYLAHRVRIEFLTGKNSYKLISRSLTQGLHRIYPKWIIGHTYRIYGEFISNLNIAKFNLKDSMYIH